MSLFDFYESDSFLHRTHPLTKLAVNLLVLLATSFYQRPLAPLLLLAALMLAALVLARLPFLHLWKAMRFFFALSALWVFFTALFTRPDAGASEVFFRLGPLAFTEYGLWWGVTRALRMLCLIAFALLLVSTTDPTDLILGLIQQGRLNYRIGYGILVGYRTIPLLQEEYDTIRAAHRVRGVREGKGIAGSAQRMRRYAIPLLAGAVRRAERAALAMESRAFGAYEERTYLRQLRFGWRDSALAAGALILLAALMPIK
ncbi:MAG: energy-coupling factor transporter transmembrane protein EcfT [Armatimonadetes bacterium]|nr:energy-coupling factor transporter transmembrane protein EcfT [Armatimonadota bacterium]